MKLEFLFCVQGVYAQIYIPGEQLQTDKIVSLLGQLYKVDLSVVIHTQVVFPAEVNFGPAISSSQLIAHNDRQIYRAFFKAHIFCSLDKNISFHIIQTQKGMAVVFFFLRCGETKRNAQGQTKDDECNFLFFHLSSFPTIIKAKSMPSFPP